MANILEEIVAAKRQELMLQKEAVPLDTLRERIASQPPPLSLSAALEGEGIRLIAEVKKASPSRGLLSPDFDPVRLAGIYSANGAAAISVLTDPRFQGELDHLAQIKSTGASGQAPVMRKDFIFDPYQVYEAIAHGADAFLLIVAILTPQQLKELLDLGHELGMQCLVEVHDEEQMQVALDASAEVIGINNRDLRTFTTDLAVTLRLAPLVPCGKVVVSESGISNRDHLRQLARSRVDSILVGEALITASDIAGKVRELAGQTVPSPGR